MGTPIDYDGLRTETVVQVAKHGRRCDHRSVRPS